MKKILIFFLGLLTGVILTIVVSVLITISNSGNLESDMRDQLIDFLDEPGMVMPVQSYKVFQTLDPNHALAHEQKRYGYSGNVVMVYKSGGDSFYDGMTLGAPQDYVFRQIGTYQYKTADNRTHTVPVVAVYPEGNDID